MGNRPAELRRALDSLLAQERVSIDAVVVGNGWDPSGIPESIKTLHLPENQGIPAGRNAGVNHVSGEYLCFLDDDSWFLDNDFLITAVNRFEKHPRWDCCSLESQTRNMRIRTRQDGFLVSTRERPLTRVRSFTLAKPV
ncbi:glycosyltransferase family 2 protein [Glutamicibacter protophormiae]|uniref:glycosyltransferase family 2 protein n=1 Tax=Glutamicibacter protophormiae TaxID=37930 RepID=UPI00361CF6D9